MSQTQFVEYRQDGFWAYDVALGVFLKTSSDPTNAAFNASLSASGTNSFTSALAPR